MRRLMASTVAVVTAAALGATSAATPRSTPPDGPDIAVTPRLACSTPGRAPLAAAPALGSGLGILASLRGTLISPTGAVQRGVPAASAGVVRHVSTRPGIGTTYVVDRRGGDVVVAVTQRRTMAIPERTEALHPTLSPTGAVAWSAGSSLRIKDGGKPILDVPVPVSGASAFAPVYIGPHELAAVMSAPPAFGSPEGTSLDNLFRVDLRTGRWRPLTRFRSFGDRWSAIRTPVLAPDGGVEFVRVSADASETVAPVFELWKVTRGGSVWRSATLDHEMYLAGHPRGGPRIWNVPVPAAGSSKIVEQLDGGRFVQVGCGSVLTDPLDAPDPDRRAAPGAVPPRGTWPGLEVAPTDGSSAVPEVAIIVGDYEQRADAESAAAAIRVAYPQAVVDVVDNASAPLAIRPGVWGALLRLPVDADPTRALTEFRGKLPDYRETSWVVTP